MVLSARAITTLNTEHYPNRSQFILPPTSPLLAAYQTALGLSNTVVRTQDGYTAYASPNPQRTPRTNFAAIHRFSIPQKQLCNHRVTLTDLLSLDVTE